MKLKTLFVLSLLSVSADAAVTIGGTILTSVRNATGAGNVASGTLALLIVDTAGDGFFNLGTSLAANSALTPLLDPKLTSSVANLAVVNPPGGANVAPFFTSTFGGETIISSISSPGGGTFSNILTSIAIAGFEGKNFAIVWFDGILKTGAPAQAPGGTKWGIIRGADWTLPAADSGTFTSSATDANGATSFFAPNAQNGGATSTAFRTTTDVTTVGAASFTIIPEPSAALLGALGALGLLRRRRI